MSVLKARKGEEVTGLRLVKHPCCQLMECYGHDYTDEGSFDVYRCEPHLRKVKAPMQDGIPASYGAEFWERNQ